MSDDNLLLRNLRSNLSADEFKATFRAYSKRKPIDMKGVYISKLVKANSTVFKEVFEMLLEDDTIEIIKEALQGSKWLKDYENEKVLEDRKRTAKNFLMLGVSIENVAKATELPVEDVMALVQ